MAGMALDSVVTGTGEVLYPYIRRYSITEDYYRYIKLANAQVLIEEGPTLTDPQAMKGNVKNGFGLFTIFAVVTDTIR